ncbi:MAG TPA: NAD(P)/FAD-dependent oxidoreductase [Nitrospiraceae bacterium]|nr:NAD(P)/FAD-dependent oxidoreductase [Nitrospiraceae bacterium]
MNTYDVCIVGAGVVGCAIARELGSRWRDIPLRVVVLEQHARPGTETSGRNSGVLHSGIHEDPSSLKGQLAREGSALAVSYALEHGIPLLRTGMVIAISWEDVRRGLWREVSMLRRLWVNAWKSNTRVLFVTPSGLRGWEPHLHACCGIIIPSVSVIDPVAFVQSLRTDAEATGAEFLFNNRLIGIEAGATDYLVTTDRLRIRAACVINAAGLHADEVAALAPHKKNYTIYPLRGEYYELVNPEKRRLIGRLVYPALPPQATGKGIHFGPRPNGQLFVGPNEVAIQDKTDYTSGKTPPGVFVGALQKFLPALDEGDLRWAYSGIRPRVVAPDGRKSDFVVAIDCEDPPFINLVGIESPGLSAALALARHVGELRCVQKRFNQSGGRSPSAHDARTC